MSVRIVKKEDLLQIKAILEAEEVEEKEEVLLSAYKRREYSWESSINLFPSYVLLLRRESYWQQGFYEINFLINLMMFDASGMNVEGSKTL